MTLPHRLLSSLLIAIVGACSSPRAAPAVASSTQGSPAALSPATIDPGAIARAEGPAGLARLLAAYDAAIEPGARAALAAQVDRAAGQRYATASRLYWYDDLAAAQAAARASGKPILSLRMLGRLDEDLSCANSRMFRTLLYPDPRVNQVLRDRFVLHWSSERPVPKVTIDYGDGRRLETTVTGNSAHYVLDADGVPLDVLPGMYAPEVFAAALTRAAALAERVRGASPAIRREQVVRHHREVVNLAAQLWQAGRRVPAVGSLLTESDLQAAMRTTVSKAAVEVPALRRVDLGVDPGRLRERPEQDAAAGVATTLWQLTAVNVFDPAATALVRALLPREAAADRVLYELGYGVIAETAVDELVLRPMISRRLLEHWTSSVAPLPFAELNAWVYAEVFRTPASDPWLGLRPTAVYTGLPGGAILHEEPRG